MKVPFLDLKAQYESIKEEVAVAIQQVLDSCAFAGGPFVERFEKEFASFCQCEYAIGVGNGTDAIWLSLLALGVGLGDEVITVPNTFIATAEAISFCGAKPVFVDVDEKTYNMDPALLEAAITSRTKAIIPVHLFGQIADMDPIMDIARANGLLVIEDACQAHGAEYKGRAAGSIGDAGCFSFYPGKNLGAYGEAGAVVTNNPALDDRIRKLRDHGQKRKYDHELIGWNARMDGFQGAILSAKLKYLAAWNNDRRRKAEIYNELLADIDELIVPWEASYSKHVYHIYAIRVKARDSLLNALAEEDIHCAIHYPVPVHLQEAYNKLGLREDSFPVAEMCANEFVSLPMFPELTREQIEYVAEQIKVYVSISRDSDYLQPQTKHHSDLQKEKGAMS
jgi:dTDP-4-amino-4,6-dideoxygalactose transaminase